MSEKLENLLEDIKRKLSRIDQKLDNVLVSQNPQVNSPTKKAVFVPHTLASLPKHLRKTAEAIAVEGDATAEQIAAKTGRSRAAESDYLNQLVNQSFLRKERRGRDFYFQVFSLFTVCPSCGTRVPINSAFCSGCGAPLGRK